MGQKVHPYGFRLGVTKTWRSRWFSKGDYAKLLHEDLQLKEQLTERLKSAGVSTIEMDRPGNKLRITIRTSRPGIIIGRKGAEIEKLKADLAKKTGREVFIDIQEVHKPELDAQLVSENIAMQLEKRVAFRRAMRKSTESAVRFGCKGIKVRISGRLNGAEIARTEWHLAGQLPLHTLRADIEYGFAEAHTTYGIIGIKCWVYKGEILDGQLRSGLSRDPEPRRAPRRDNRDRGGGGDRRPGGYGGPGGGGYQGGGGGYSGGQQSAPPPSGPATQAAPGDMPKPTQSPIMPPMSAPAPQPNWKQEVKPPSAEPAAEKPAADTGAAADQPAGEKSES